MNPDPDYSAAYVVLRTDAADGLDGHGFVFTIGRGNDVRSPRSRPAPIDLLGRTSRSCSATWARPGELLVHDSQLRWLGPEKGVMHMAIGAVRQRPVGPEGQARRPAAVAAARPA